MAATRPLPSIVTIFEAGEQHVGVAEAAEVAHPHRVENAVQMVTFVLHDARVETLDLAGDGPARRIEAAVVQPAAASALD